VAAELPDQLDKGKVTEDVPEEMILKLEKKFHFKKLRIRSDHSRMSEFLCYQKAGFFCNSSTKLIRYMSFQQLLHFSPGLLLTVLGGILPFDLPVRGTSIQKVLT